MHAAAQPLHLHILRQRQLTVAQRHAPSAILERFHLGVVHASAAVSSARPCTRKTRALLVPAPTPRPPGAGRRARARARRVPERERAGHRASASAEPAPRLLGPNGPMRRCTKRTLASRGACGVVGVCRCGRRADPRRARRGELAPTVPRPTRMVAAHARRSPRGPRRSATRRARRRERRRLPSGGHARPGRLWRRRVGSLSPSTASRLCCGGRRARPVGAHKACWHYLASRCATTLERWTRWSRTRPPSCTPSRTRRCAAPRANAWSHCWAPAWSSASSRKRKTRPQVVRTMHDAMDGVVARRGVPCAFHRPCSSPCSRRARRSLAPCARTSRRARAFDPNVTRDDAHVPHHARGVRRPRSGVRRPHVRARRHPRSPHDARSGVAADARAPGRARLPASRPERPARSTLALTTTPA